ncbi:GIN domain-containing protein [Marinoscillum sp.]|uniref:GIN domain-containing protein n=1 Tax=Marinoscillum sp. TaxID=2024838 RepID=UPI003BA979E0
MKASKKILLTVAGIFSILLIISLIAFRKQTMMVVAEIQAKSPYRTVETGYFDALEFTGNWMVRVAWGVEPQVRLDVEDSAFRASVLENVEGTLRFSVNAISDTLFQDTIRVKITVPKLRKISASGVVLIDYSDFDSDSLEVVLEGRSTFSGTENVFDYTSFEVSGDSQIRLSK